MTIVFQQATRRKAKLRLALSGPSGSGKSLSALLLAKGMGGRTAVLDTERGSASLYAEHPLLGGFKFDVLEMVPPYSPEHYIEVIQAAEKAGYANLILDSITHEWNGIGGVLEIVENISRAKFKGNSYAAWNEGTPRHRAFVDAMLQANMHIIATMRSKTAYAETDKGGRKTYEKIGLQPEQRDNIEYEFTSVLDLSNNGNLAAPSKDRTAMFKDPFLITEKTGAKFVEWLNSGSDVPKPEPTLTEKATAFAKQLLEAKTMKDLTKIQNDNMGLIDILAKGDEKAAALYKRLQEIIISQTQTLQPKKKAAEKKAIEKAQQAVKADALPEFPGAKSLNDPLPEDMGGPANQPVRNQA